MDTFLRTTYLFLILICAKPAFAEPRIQSGGGIRFLDKVLQVTYVDESFVYLGNPVNNEFVGKARLYLMQNYITAEPSRYLEPNSVPMLLNPQGPYRKIKPEEEILALAKGGILVDLQGENLPLKMARIKSVTHTQGGYHHSIIQLDSHDFRPPMAGEVEKSVRNGRYMYIPPENSSAYLSFVIQKAVEPLIQKVNVGGVTLELNGVVYFPDRKEYLQIKRISRQAIYGLGSSALLSETVKLLIENPDLYRSPEQVRQILHSASVPRPSLIPAIDLIPLNTNPEGLLLVSSEYVLIVREMTHEEQHLADRIAAGEYSLKAQLPRLIANKYPFIRALYPNAITFRDGNPILPFASSNYEDLISVSVGLHEGVRNRIVIQAPSGGIIVYDLNSHRFIEVNKSCGVFGEQKQ